MIAIFLASFYILVNLYLVRWVLRWTGACHRVFGTRAFRAVFIVLYALIASAPLTGFLIRSPYALRKTLLFSAQRKCRGDEGMIVRTAAPYWPSQRIFCS